MTRYLLLLITTLLLPLCAQAQGGLTARYNMVYLDMAAGLPNNYVDDIFQDSNGFVWIATQGGGLVRYDGFSYLSFSHDRQGIQLRSNSCRNICEDPYKRLWVAFDDGLQLLSLKTLQPTEPSYATGQLATAFQQLQKEHSLRVYCDAKGNVWIVYPQKLVRIAFDPSGTIASILSLSHAPYTTEPGIRDIYGKGTVIMGNRGHVYEISAKGNRLVRHDITTQFPGLNGQSVSDIAYYNHKIWLATNAGLFNNGQGRNSYHCSSQDHSLQHDVVTTLALSPEGLLLAGTLCGVDIIDDKTGTIEHWNTGSAVNPLSSNYVNCLLCKNGQIWGGTESGGITKLMPRQLELTNYPDITGETSPIRHRAVNAMYVEPDGTLWVGIMEGGLHRLSPDGTATAHYTTANSPLVHNSVSALTPDEDGNLWIGTWGTGISVMPLSSPSQMKRFTVDPARQGLLYFIGTMAYDKINHGVWIGANEGVFFYNLRTGQLEEPIADNRSIRGCIGHLITRNSHLLIGCLQGMLDIDLRSRPTGKGLFAAKHYRYKLDNPQSGIIEKVLCFCEGRDGRIWIGSNGYGLYSFTLGKGGSVARCDNYTMADGLANNTVKGIAEDKDGMLWIATSNGLSLFNPQTKTFNNFYQRDGLISSQFYFNAATTYRHQTIYLGTDRGLIAIKGERFADNYAGNLRFTSLQVDNQPIFADGHYLEEDISTAREISLHESDRSFTINFSALNYGSETQGVYSYRMKGFENEWIQLQPGQHSVRYSTLPSGHYEFQVRYAPSIGSGLIQTATIRVHVSPYFWKSWWFVSLVIIGMAVVAAWLYRQRMEKMRDREVEALYRPIELALKESEEPSKLQSRIQTILENQRRFQESQEKTVEADKKEVEENTTPFMEKLMQIMEAHYENSEFGVGELAEAIGMNRSALSKTINAETGTPTAQFIRNYRLGVAKKMIEDNVAGRNITEIAYRVGFNDPKYFTRCFTKQFGVAPSAYKASQE